MDDPGNASAGAGASAICTLDQANSSVRYDP